MYAEVIPSLRLPAAFDIFDYLIPDELYEEVFPGSLVRVPYRGRVVTGLVYRIKKDSEFAEKILAIKSVIFKIPFFDQDYLDLIDHVSKYYLISKTSVFKALMPAIPKRISSDKVELIYSQVTSRKKLPQSNDDFYDSQVIIYQDKQRFLAQIIDFIDAGTKEKQYIVLLPQIKSVLRAAKSLQNYANINVSLLHCGLSKTDYWQNWYEFVSGYSNVLIATRIGVLTPAKNLHGIFVLDEESSDYKQYDQNPRYDSRSLAEWLSKKKNIPVIFASQSPTLDRWHWAKTSDYRIVALPHKLPDVINFIDIEQERRKKNFSLVSDDLRDASFRALESGKKVIMFLNRKGFATMINCRDCGYVYLCPECGIPLIAHKKYISCHHCCYRGEMPLSCEKCRGTNIKISGAGLEKLEQQLADIYGDHLILRLDKDTTLGKKFNLRKYEIIIGTNYITKDYEDQLDADLNVGVIGIINADNLFNFADYRTTERVWQEMRKIINLAARTRSELCIQTLRPENQILRNLDDIDRFYVKELASRKKFAMPPAVKLVKIVVYSTFASEAADRAKSICQLLENVSDDKIKEILGPYSLHPEKKRGYYRQAILLKAEKDRPLDFLTKLCHNSVIIDVDPEFVLT